VFGMFQTREPPLSQSRRVFRERVIGTQKSLPERGDICAFCGEQINSVRRVGGSRLGCGLGARNDGKQQDQAGDAFHCHTPFTWIIVAVCTRRRCIGFQRCYG